VKHRPCSQTLLYLTSTSFSLFQSTTTFSLHSILDTPRPTQATPNKPKNSQTTTSNMVFQSRKNCRGAAQALPKSVLTKLPDELLLKLLHQMDITEVLRLRETSRFFVDTCTEVMRDKLEILYVHPSPSSVARAISICKKSDLSSEVEICFLSKAPLRQDDYRITLHQRQWAFHNPRDDVERPVPPFSHTYQELLSSLAKLEGLHTFSFRESCDRPGFNALSTQRING